MTDRWEQIRGQARRRHAEVLALAGGDPSAAALLAAAERLTGIACEALPAGHPLLDGGDAEFDPADGVIWYNTDLDPDVAAFYRAHEYAHHWLGDGAATCTADDIEAGAAEEPLPVGVRRVEGYGPHERKELAANVFAREFLLPSDRLRDWFVEGGLSASDIAARVGVPDGLVQHQIARALVAAIVPTPGTDDYPPDGASGGANQVLALDPSQAAAARAARGPVLVEAGPGTGKTSTLTARIAHLLASGTPPEAILALTFSNKAAQEMRERVALVAPAEAPRIWIGTFHAFGLELLRKHGPRIGLPPRPTIIDSVDALFILERALPALPLDHYRNLYEPTISLRDILGAISRAKDEPVDPAAYTELAAAMRARATTDEEVVAAEKALEVAAGFRGFRDRSLQAIALHYHATRDILDDEQRRSYALVSAELVRRGLAAPTSPPPPTVASTDPEALRWEALVDEGLAQGLRVLRLVQPGWYVVFHPESRTGELVQPLADGGGWVCSCAEGDHGDCPHVALVRWERGEWPGGEQ